MEVFPAVLIGGPPHSGKSVLTYNLTRMLRADIDHYVLRAYPDGEGDWSYQSDPETVRTIRVKGFGNPRWIDRVCRDILNRPLPLLVDVGGRPQPWQEAVFDCCTHAILLAPDEDSLRQWQMLARRHHLIILAELTSRLLGEQSLSQTAPVLRGVITGLRPDLSALPPGPLTEALIALLKGLLYRPHADLIRHQLAAAPAETALDLTRLAITLGSPDGYWRPEQLPALFDYLPAGVALAACNRAPGWIYAALALHAQPEPFYQFDARLGWVVSPALIVGPPNPANPLSVSATASPDYTHCAFSIPDFYLDYPADEDDRLVVPPAPPDGGLILSGQLPNWLYTALARLYRPAVPWLAIYQPQLNGAAVIHAAPTDDYPVGSVIRC